MKSLNTFLEGLLDKSNKAGVMDIKELIISTIEDRIKDQKSDFKDRITTIMDTLGSIYKPFKTTRIRPSVKPRCFICTYSHADGNLFAMYFIWVQTRDEKTYWDIEWGLGCTGQYSDYFDIITERTKSYNIGAAWGKPLACYEIPEEDMKDYFRTICKPQTPTQRYNKEEIGKIEQITA